MRRFCVWLVFSMLLCAGLQAQTRKIGHRSHSGKSATFAMWMGEEHLGDPVPMKYVNYEVEPMILRIRKHYEEIAKQGPVAKTGNPKSVEAPKVIAPIDSVNLNSPAPTQSTELPKSSTHPKTKKNSKEPLPTATTVPSPDFLVKARPKTKAAFAAKTNGQGSSSLWMLLGLLAFPVAPAVFFASAVRGRKRDEA